MIRSGCNSLTEGWEIMALEPIKEWKIDSEEEADAYLKDLLSHPGYSSMSVVNERAQAHVKDVGEK
jgi:hypothetical protein